MHILYLFFSSLHRLVQGIISWFLHFPGPGSLLQEFRWTLVRNVWLHVRILFTSIIGNSQAGSAIEQHVMRSLNLNKCVTVWKIPEWILNSFDVWFFFSSGNLTCCIILFCVAKIPRSNGCVWSDEWSRFKRDIHVNLNKKSQVLEWNFDVFFLESLT